MARALIAKVTAPGTNAGAGVPLTMTPADATNKNYFLCSGRSLLVVYNSGEGSHTYTVNSTADERGRTKDVTADAIAAGAIEILGPFSSLGWVQPGTNQINCEANDAEVLFGVIDL